MLLPFILKKFKKTKSETVILHETIKDINLNLHDLHNKINNIDLNLNNLQEKININNINLQDLQEKININNINFQKFENKIINDNLKIKQLNEKNFEDLKELTCSKYDDLKKLINYNTKEHIEIKPIPMIDNPDNPFRSPLLINNINNSQNYIRDLNVLDGDINFNLNHINLKSCIIYDKEQSIILKKNKKKVHFEIIKNNNDSDGGGDKNNSEDDNINNNEDSSIGLDEDIMNNVNFNQSIYKNHKFGIESTDIYFNFKTISIKCLDIIENLIYNVCLYFF
jgi:hypothetical protein